MRWFRKRRYQYQDAKGDWHQSLVLFEDWLSGCPKVVTVSCGRVQMPIRRRRTSKPPTCPECLERYGKILAGSRQKEK